VAKVVEFQEDNSETILLHINLLPIISVPHKFAKIVVLENKSLQQLFIASKFAW
jgi:hypothetical protein